MPVKIAVASGKGGTGKTTVSVNLFNWVKANWSQKVQLVDCDVEEPNDHIFLPEYNFFKSIEIAQSIPKIDTNNCTFCRNCVDWCVFNAIVVIPPLGFAEINQSLCHSCGACLMACQKNAINEFPVTIGYANFYTSDDQSSFIEGRLKIGSAMQTMLIRELKKQKDSTADIIIFDSPPGTSCPVVESVAGVDYIILVGEPTPFGLYDLELTVALLRQIKIDFGVVINKSGIGNQDIYDFLKKEKIFLLGEIPFSKEYASDYSMGKLSNSNKLIVNQYNIIGNKLKSKFL
jgi:MinD superfamily P-loop ATPase